MTVLNFPAKPAAPRSGTASRPRIGFPSIDDVAHGALLASWLALTVAVVVRTL